MSVIELEQPAAVGTAGGDLQGQVAIVTGGARGLGEAICRALASAGATVVPVDVRYDLLERMASSLRRDGARVFPLRVDVGDETQAAAAVDRVLSTHGRLDALVNSAGVDVPLPIDELPIEDWDRIVRVNLRGPFLMSRFALAPMKAARRGHIVNVASTAAKRAWTNASACQATRWGLLGLSHALQVEALPSGVKVSAVIAGGIPELDPELLQEPAHVASTVRFLLTTPPGTAIPGIMVLPMRETSWP